MKVICKRTYFYTNHQQETKCLFEKNKHYLIKEEDELIVTLICEENRPYSLSKNNFNKFFETIEDSRQKKINEILNR